MGKRGLKVGPALQTRAHAPYSDLSHASVPPALCRGWGWGEGAEACTVGTRAFGPSPLAEAHTRSSARAHTHLGHSHSASRDTRPERAHPTHTLTHACSHAHTQPLVAPELRADPGPPPRKSAH